VTDNRLAYRLIGNSLSNLSEPGVQLSLMNSTEQQLEKLNYAVDRIQDKYGFTAIQQPEQRNSSRRTKKINYINSLISILS
jgi:hypothetical protein